MRSITARCIFPLVMAFFAAASTAAEAIRIDDATRAEIVKTLAQKIDEEYVFPDKAKLVVARLNAQQQRGAYAKMVEPERFASALTADLREPTNDLHLRVLVSAEPIPEDTADAEPDPEMVKGMLEDLKKENFGVHKVDTLAGNIGYIDLRMFAPLEFAKETIARTMQAVSDKDALIVDLRRNGGGDPATVAFMSSYLFDQRTHLNDMYWRREGRVDEFWTQDDVPGKRFGGKKKVYVLTSKKTFSGAEEFSYNLQQLKRGTLVGETTGGGAHPGGVQRLHKHFSVFIPSGRAINPISKTNWEGTGVVPDVSVAAEDALTTAEKRALQDLLTAPRDAAQEQLLRKRIEELGRSGQPPGATRART